MRVLILHDEPPAAPRPDEADTLAQAHFVARVLAAEGHAPSLLPCGLDLRSVGESIRAAAPEVVFNLVESIDGKGRLIHLAPALLETLPAPFVGAGSCAMFCASNKVLAKRLLQGAGLPTAPFMTLESLRAGAVAPPAKYIVKSLWEHASVGLDEDSVVFAHSAAELAAAIEERLPALGGEGFAEAFIDGREFNLSVLDEGDGPRVLPPAEIVFEGYAPDKPCVVGYRSKWDESSYEYHHTPRRFEFPPADGALLQLLARDALACWSLFGLRGWARVDFRVDREGRPYILEANANPCLSPDAGFAAACAREGRSVEQVVLALVERAASVGAEGLSGHVSN